MPTPESLCPECLYERCHGDIPAGVQHTCDLIREDVKSRKLENTRTPITTTEAIQQLSITNALWPNTPNTTNES